MARQYSTAILVVAATLLVAWASASESPSSQVVLKGGSAPILTDFVKNDGECEFAGKVVASGKRLTGTTQDCLCNNGKWVDCRSIKRLTATFNEKLLKGTISVVQGTDKTVARWEAKFDYIDKHGLCPSGEMNWHVHEKWPKGAPPSGTFDECRFDLIGNHYDPTFGCTGASQFAGPGGLCSIVRAESNGVQTCDLHKDVSTCEIGDQSGKLGRIQLVKYQEWDDAFMTNLDNLYGTSVLMHCCQPDGSCAPRTICAALV